MKYSYFILGCILLLLYSCPPDKPPVTNDCPPVEKLTGERKNLNISIFLDLSDRISEKRNPLSGMGQVERDFGYINSITSAFQNHLRNKPTRSINDRITTYFNPLPDNIDSINDLSEKLKIEFSKNNATLENICEVNDKYSEITDVIYNAMLEQKEPLATDDNDPYPGSDIFGFFKSNVKDYCVKDGYRNILFILTDGYEYYEPGNPNIDESTKKSNYLLSRLLNSEGFNKNNYLNKIKDGYGFQVPVQGLEDLEVYVIGLSPHESWELDVLNHYWSDWLKEMGVKNFQGEDSKQFLKKTDLPSNLDESIKEIIYSN